MTNEEQQSFGEEVIERVAEWNEDAIVLEPRSTFNRAIIGSDTDYRIVYSVKRIIDALMEDNEVDDTDALEHFEVCKTTTNHCLCMKILSSNEPQNSYESTRRTRRIQGHLESNQRLGSRA